MPPLTLQDFGSGWVPSDDPFNGNHKGLSIMDNFELDQNGALTLTSGTSLVYTLTSGDYAHSLYTFYYNGILYTFLATHAGSVVVLVGNTPSVLSGSGSRSIAAFGLAFSYVLIASGNYRQKYTTNGNTVNLGITPPSAAPTTAAGNADYTALISPTTYNIENNDTVTPSSSSLQSVAISSFNQSSDNWQAIGPGNVVITGAVVTDTVTTPPGFGVAIKAIIKNTDPAPGDIDLNVTISARSLSIPNSSLPGNDTLTLYIRQDQQYLSTAGNFILVFKDNAGMQGSYAFNTTSIKQINTWLTLTVKRSDFSGALNWSSIVHIEAYANVALSSIPGNPTTVNLWLGGGSFSTIVVTPGTPATIGTSSSMTAICYANSVVFESQLLTNSIDWSNFIGGSFQTDNDVLSLQLTINSGSISSIASIQVSVLLTNPGANFVTGTDYYNHIWTNPGIASNTTPYTITINRRDFNRVGNNQLTWLTVYGIIITVTVSTAVSLTITGKIPNNTINQQYYFGFYGGTNSLNGTYQYAQMFVNNNGSYLGKSVLGPASANIVINNSTVNITPQNPIPLDPQVNEVWVFRRGTDLDQWYRVLLFNNSTGFLTPQTDNLSSISAEKLDITVNANLVSIASASISQPILDIVGPMEGRWFFFTQEFCYPSDQLDPDLVDASLSVRVTNGPLEIYMWARKVNEGTIFVGTSKDIYVLSGTFATLPDGSIDVYYRPLSVNYPPISPDAFLYEFTIYYMTASGWRSINMFGGNASLTSPILDKLYTGQSAFTYFPVPTTTAITNGTRFPIVIVANKLWCGVSSTSGPGFIHVWDFVRNYWRPINLSAVDGNTIQVTAAYISSDGKPLLAFNNGKIRKLGIYDNPLHIIDNTAPITATFQTLNYPPENVNNRKDFYTVKGRTTPNLSFQLNFVTDEMNVILNIAADSSGLFISDFQQVCVGKYFYINISATGVNKFTFSNITVIYDDHPELVTSHKVFPTNFGEPNKKRIRVWPFVIDTQGSDIHMVPIIDGTLITVLDQTFNTVGPTTVFFNYTIDAFGVDYSMLMGGLSGTIPAKPFEIWDIGKPDILEVLPIARRYWQAGPREFFRYGQVDFMVFRLLAFGTAIPYSIFINDQVVYTGVFHTVPGVEALYETPTPKGTSGQILRIEMGPTLFDFHVYYVHCRVKETGSYTAKEWIVVPEQG